jgi:hypothetical protein
MKPEMRAWILLAIFFVFVSGCGGGSEGGKIISANGTITSSGGSLKLSDGGQATFDAGIVTGATVVSMIRTSASSPAESEPVAISPSYTVEVPVTSIALPADDTSSLEKGMTLQIPVSSDLSGKVAGLFSSVPLDAYKFVEITIEDADTPKMTGSVVNKLGMGQKIKLAASYVVSSGSAVVHITHDSLAAAVNGAISGTIQITARVVDTYKLFLSVGPELHAVNNSTDFVKLSEPVNLHGRMPVILVHGWQGLNDRFSKEPHKDAWKNFIDYYLC